MMLKVKHSLLCVILSSFTPQWSLAQTAAEDLASVAIQCGADKSGLTNEEFHECISSVPSFTFKDLTSIYDPLVQDYKYWGSVDSTSEVVEGVRRTLEEFDFELGSDKISWNLGTSDSDEEVHDILTLEEHDSRLLSTTSELCSSLCAPGNWNVMLCRNILNCRRRRRRLGHSPFSDSGADPSVNALIKNALQPGYVNLLKKKMIDIDTARGTGAICSKIAFDCIVEICEEYLVHSKVTTLKLLNTLTHEATNFNSGDTIDLNGPAFTITAETDSPVGSVEFGTDFTPDVVTSYTAPYSFTGSGTRGRDLSAANWFLAVGEHTMTVTPYSTTGEAGEPYTVFFTVIDSYDYPTDFKATGFTINFSHGPPIQNLEHGEVVTLDQLLENISVECHTVGDRPIEEVQFFFDHSYKGKSTSYPFTINVRNDLMGAESRPGLHWLHVIPYAYDESGVLEKGSTISLIFDVVVPEAQLGTSN